jgi:hypothetical protein
VAPTVPIVKAVRSFRQLSNECEVSHPCPETRLGPKGGVRDGQQRRSVDSVQRATRGMRVSSVAAGSVRFGGDGPYGTELSLADLQMAERASGVRVSVAR